MFHTSLNHYQWYGKQVKLMEKLVKILLKRNFFLLNKAIYCHSGVTFLKTGQHMVQNNAQEISLQILKCLREQYFSV